MATKVRTGVGDLGEVEIKDNVDFKIVIEPTIKKCLESIFQDVLDNLARIPIMQYFFRKSLVLG